LLYVAIVLSQQAGGVNNSRPRPKSLASVDWEGGEEYTTPPATALSRLPSRSVVDEGDGGGGDTRHLRGWERDTEKKKKGKKERIQKKKGNFGSFNSHCRVLRGPMNKNNGFSPKK
jgi:hypothetical protein